MAQKTYPSETMTVVDQKTCVKCGETKSREADFSRDRSRPDGLYPYCVPCRNANRAQRYRREVSTVEGREARRQASWRRMLASYGLTVEGYAEIHEAQSGVCAICRQPERFRNTDGLRPLVVDHDHATGTVRGLLCHACNVVLGLAADDPDRLESAARYLRGRS